MTSIHNTFACLGLVATLCSTAAAQSEIIGIDVRNDESFRSTPGNFLADYTVLNVETRALFGMDFNADGSILYAMDRASLEIVTIDPATGLSAPTGIFVPNITALLGMTAAPDGVTWYIAGRNLTTLDSELFVGDITTGIFTLVGSIENGATIDIAMNAQGELYGLSISTDSLLSIDPATGLGTVIGPIGSNANFAQGMDFDPSTGELIAAIHTTAGNGTLASLDLTTGAATVLADTSPLGAEIEMAIRLVQPDTLGTPYCMPSLNSTGVTSQLSAIGSASVAVNDVTLTAESLPPIAFGFFLASTMQDFITNPGGSSGNLCLGGSIGRYVGPGQILNSGSTGTFTMMIDVTAIPQPNGFVSIAPGETWNFQAWHRDVGIGSAASNLSNGLEITFN